MKLIETREVTKNYSSEDGKWSITLRDGYVFVQSNALSGCTGCGIGNDLKDAMEKFIVSCKKLVAAANIAIADAEGELKKKEDSDGI